MSYHCNVFVHQGESYEIVDKVNASMFQNRNGSVNERVLGIYVNKHKANRVVQKENKLLILKEIEDAIIEKQ